jgi:hypothetical protein
MTRQDNQVPFPPQNMGGLVPQQHTIVFAEVSKELKNQLLGFRWPTIFGVRIFGRKRAIRLILDVNEIMSQLHARLTEMKELEEIANAPAIKAAARKAEEAKAKKATDLKKLRAKKATAKKK